jgi:hypothetical protein
LVLDQRKIEVNIGPPLLEAINFDLEAHLETKRDVLNNSTFDTNLLNAVKTRSFGKASRSSYSPYSTIARIEIQYLPQRRLVPRWELTQESEIQELNPLNPLLPSNASGVVKSHSSVSRLTREAGTSLWMTSTAVGNLSI